MFLHRVPDHPIATPYRQLAQEMMEGPLLAMASSTTPLPWLPVSSGLTSRLDEGMSCDTISNGPSPDPRTSVAGFFAIADIVAAAMGLSSRVASTCVCQFGPKKYGDG